jgi:hypothetical protein
MLRINPVYGYFKIIKRFFEDRGIEFKKCSHVWTAKNTFIHFRDDGVVFDTGMAESLGGKPVDSKSWIKTFGDVYMTYDEQEKLFKALKRVVNKHKKELSKSIEDGLDNKKEDHDKKIAEMKSMLDFDNNVIAVEHKLEDQIRKTLTLYKELIREFPNLSDWEAEEKLNPHEVDGSKKSRISNIYHITLQANWLNHILVYLQAEEIEAIHLLKDSENPIMVKKNKKQVRILKKHLNKLTSKLFSFLDNIKYFYKKEIRIIPYSTKVKDNLREFYEQLIPIYEWYYEYFKKLK